MPAVHPLPSSDGQFTLLAPAAARCNYKLDMGETLSEVRGRRKPQRHDMPGSWLRSPTPLPPRG